MVDMLTVLKVPQKRAVAYYRHSAEDKQENSIDIQRQETEKFAANHQIEIIHEELDEGKSGLNASRPGFIRLFNDWIENKLAPNFDFVLVYDVSRWGRFQDQDESAYLVHLCKRSGKQVVYTSRGFPDANQQLMTSLEISIQRYMAAEYSRQLSGKTFLGAVKVSEQGYSSGGIPQYGLGRVLLDVNRKPIKNLKPGERKCIANERVVFTPKNDKTTKIVSLIFNLYANDRLSIQNIANYLNENKIPPPNSKTWTYGKVHHILTNPAYVGTKVYNRTGRALKQKHRNKPKSEWIITPDAFKGIIDKVTFNKTQEMVHANSSARWPNTWPLRKNRYKIIADISSWLVSKGATLYEATEISRDLPIVFATGTNSDTRASICFSISEKIRKYTHLIGITILPQKQPTVDSFFYLPVTQISHRLYHLIEDRNYLEHQIDNAKFEYCVRLLAKQFREANLGSSNKFAFLDNL